MRLNFEKIAWLSLIANFIFNMGLSLAPESLPEQWRPNFWLTLFITIVAGIVYFLTKQLLGKHQPDPEGERKKLLRKLRPMFQKMLNNRLFGQSKRIALDLTRRPEMVAPVSSLPLEFPNHDPQAVPPDWSILKVFDEAGLALLILGKPGAGKSVLLLELAEALLERAEQDPKEPMPLVLTLDTWTKGDLKEWFAREANLVYGIGLDLARRWIDEKALIPLLDGLDEIPQERRSEAVQAINRFLHDKRRGTLPIAVCSRTAEYEALHDRLRLNDAVEIEPLSDEQVEDYLKAGGAALEGLKRMRTKSSELRDLLKTPLGLSIATITFTGRPETDLAFANEAEGWQQLWKSYVKRMLRRDRDWAMPSRWPAGDDWRALRHLHWLARVMMEQNVSVFYIERLQPTWMPASARLTYRFAWHLASGLTSWLAGGVALGLLMGLSGSPEFMPALIVFGLSFGLAVGLFNFYNPSIHRIKNAEFGHRSWRWRLGWGLVVSLAWGLAFGLPVGLAFGPAWGLALGSLFGLAFGLAWGLALVLFSFYDPSVIIKDLEVGRRSSRRMLLAQLAWLLIWGLAFGLAFGLVFGLVVVESGLASGLALALLSGIAFGMFGGGVFGWFGILHSLDEPSTIQNVEVIRWSWKLGIWQVVGLMLFLAIGLILGILMRLIWGLEPGLGLVAGLVMGVFALLGSFWESDKVDDSLRQRPNEGILRSLGHALRIGVPFAIGSALLAALSIPLATSLPASFAPPAMQVIAFSTLVAGSFLTWANGGRACLLHLFLRLALWRAGVAPWNYAALLNAACHHLLMRQRGGGFEFWHLTLRDFLAGRSEAELKELLLKESR